MSDDLHDSDYEDGTHSQKAIRTNKNYSDFLGHGRATRQRNADVKNFCGLSYEELFPSQPSERATEQSNKHEQSSDSDSCDLKPAPKKRRTATGPTEVIPAKKAQFPKRSTGNASGPSTSSRSKTVSSRLGDHTKAQVQAPRSNPSSRKLFDTIPEAKAIIIRANVATGAPPKDLTVIKLFHLHQIVDFDRCQTLVMTKFREALHGLGLGISVEVLSVQLENVEHIGKSDKQLNTDQRWISGVDGYRAYNVWVADVKKAVADGRTIQPRIRVVVRDDRSNANGTPKASPAANTETAITNSKTDAANTENDAPITKNHTANSKNNAAGSNIVRSKLRRIDADPVEPTSAGCNDDDSDKTMEDLKAENKALKSQVKELKAQHARDQNTIQGQRHLLEEDAPEIPELRRANAKLSSTVQQYHSAVHSLLVPFWKARAGVDISKYSGSDGGWVSAGGGCRGCQEW